MTALNYVLQREQVLIATDSLAIDPQSKRPMNFVTKVFPLPHVAGVICGTGALELLIEWVVLVQTGIYARSILDLDGPAQQCLPEIGKRLELGPDVTTTIYHFGYLEAESRFAGFAYRSLQGFKSERLQDSLGIKPPLDDDAHEAATRALQVKGAPDAFIDLVERQKTHDEHQTREDRVGIGGEVHVLQLNPKGYVLAVCHRFEDYSEAWAAIVKYHRGRSQLGPK